MWLLSVLFLGAAGLISCGEELVDYYENLIKQEIEKASKYQFPKDASAYKGRNSRPKEFGVFDYIIIGGGSAGSVVASRLSEVEKWNILLLEAGAEENNFTDIPAMSKHTHDHNWGFNSTPQTTCCLAWSGVCPYPRGKSLGGTSTINAMVYSRGNRLDYDTWAALGNPGWSYDDVLPYFIKSENSRIEGDEGYHGTGGYLNVEYHTPTSSKVDVFLQANKELGVPLVDYNGKEQLGAARIQFTAVSGKRESSAKAFLGPVRNRSNLRILTESYVTKILIANSTKKAFGVLFSHNNTEYMVKSRKEIILSAGVIGSPHLLMLSGVGPANDLKQHGISVIKNLAVGQELHDHLTFYHMHFLSPKPEPSVKLREAIKQFVNGTGPLTGSTNPQGVSFYRLGQTNTSYPDLEIVIVPSIKSTDYVEVNNRVVQDHVDRTYINFWGNSAIQNHIFQLVLVLQHPKTRGKVYLKSSNPYEYPLIDSKCMADPQNEDIQVMYKAVETVSKLAETETFKGLNAVILPFPTCMTHQFLSKEYWICVIRQTAMNAFHGGGTCKMGPHPSEGAVVDNKLKVHGISNLRIADTSIVPVTLSAHMHAPAVMIGERLADFIKKENKISTQ